MKLLSLLHYAALALALPVEQNGLAVRDLEKRQYATSSTENQFSDGSACRAVTILFARGTTEAGNVGSSAGPPFFQALANEIGASNLAVQGVSIPLLLAWTIHELNWRPDQLSSKHRRLPGRRRQRRCLYHGISGRTGPEQVPEYQALPFRLLSGWPSGP